MNDNNQDYQVCPVCYSDFIALPHGVCSVCYEKLKKQYVHTYEYWDNEHKKISKSFDKPFNPEFHEKNILTSMKSDVKYWKLLSENGLSPVQVLTDILDGIDADTGTDADIVWHRRRIAFMKNLAERIVKVYDDYFTPVTGEQVTYFLQCATDFWDGKLSDRDAKKRHDELMRILKKEDITEWDRGSFLLWMFLQEDQFDWMWGQWFESIRMCIPDTHTDDLWIELLHKHFSEEIRAWVDRE